MTEPFKFSDGQLAYTIEELISICQKSPSESLEYLMREDFEKWLDYIGKSDLAAKARQVRQASLSDGDRIKQFITQCQGVSISTKELSPKTPTSDVSKPKVPTPSTAVETTTAAPATEVTAPSTAAKVPAAPPVAKVPTAKVPTASTAAKVPAAPPAAKVPTASTAAKVPAAPPAAKVPAASTAAKIPAAPTATKKTNPLASLFQKLFGKK